VRVLVADTALAPAPEVVCLMLVATSLSCDSVSARLRWPAFLTKRQLPQSKSAAAGLLARHLGLGVLFDETAGHADPFASAGGSPVPAFS
jgi:hypothetical protein